MSTESESVVRPGRVFTPGSVEADGFTVRYFEAGTGDPVVRVHGAGGPLFSYALDDLARTNRVIELELPGFGSSPINDRTDGAAALADTVAAAIDALGVAPAHVWGTSMGGLVATHLAVRHPEVVRSLILEAPGAFRVGGRNPADLSAEETVRAFNSHPERVAWRQRGPVDPVRWRLVTRIMGPEYDSGLAGRLSEISVPTLVMFGLDDGIFPPTGGAVYRDKVPHCAYVLVEDGAHDLQGDQPEVCAGLVRQFLADGLGFTVSHRQSRIEPST